MKPDAQRHHDVMTERQREPSLHAAELGVQVLQGTVALTGTAPPWAGRQQALTAAPSPPTQETP